MALSSADTAECLDLLGECTEMWDDPAAWQDHLTASIEDLIGGCAGTFAANRATAGNTVVTLEANIAPTDLALRERFQRYLLEGAFTLLPETPLIVSPILRHGRLCYVQSDLVSRRAYCRSTFFQRYMRSFRIADLVSAVELRPDGIAIGLSVMRQSGERRFSERERAMLALLATGLARLVGERLATREHVTRSDLPPRLRKTLDILLEGTSEKELAQRLGIAPATVHEYVMAIYRYYDVNSRSRLMAHFVRRRPTPRTR